MRISDWSSDVCSSNLNACKILEPFDLGGGQGRAFFAVDQAQRAKDRAIIGAQRHPGVETDMRIAGGARIALKARIGRHVGDHDGPGRGNDMAGKADVARGFARSGELRSDGATVRRETGRETRWRKQGV